ncbi:MAG TPA: hypothetical protein VM553_15745, partial [Dongiaceae bacterium]|nr:hypothetical protein [Dongiaceae bacterium]
CITAVLLASLLGCSALKESTHAETEARPLPPRKPLPAVVVEDFTRDTQVIRTSEYSFVQAWWIPVEFWQAALSKVNPALAQQSLDVLKPYSMLAVVQADVTALGGFVFYPRADLQSRLQLQYQAAGGEKVTLSPVQQPNSTLQNLITQLSPLLSRAMGEMGRNMQFFVFDDARPDGTRIVDPYNDGVLQVVLAQSETQAAQQLDVGLPANALYEARRCADGRPAHISWRYCPWDGQPL